MNEQDVVTVHSNQYIMISWNYMNSLKDTQRTNLVQCMHDWQNIGKYNLQFQETEAENPDDHKVCTEVHTVCPFKYG